SLKSYNHWVESIFYQFSERHQRYLLARCGEYWKSKAELSLNAFNNQPLAIQFFGEKLNFSAEQLEFDSRVNFSAWSLGLVVSILDQNKRALDTLLQWPKGEYKNKSYDSGCREYMKTFHCLLRAYFENEQDRNIREQLANEAKRWLKPGEITRAVGPDAEKFYLTQYAGPVLLICNLWGLDSLSLDERVKYAIEQDYLYFSEYLPTNAGRETGDKSLDLCAPGSYLTLLPLGLLALHYQRTGETPSFDSPYIPLRLIQSEGPTREEVLANPPPFTLEAIMGTRT
ncbi:Imm49 family immunity protein, partial [Vibrio sp. Of7-15]|uniref:Imm49 family immunity protein n=1 Tax=Vibrio sp. Of7-15 TaxID=2724879 RepID=UPI001EF2F919